MGNVVKIYVRLLGEGINVWRPVDAEMVAVEGYRILGEMPEGERWSFKPQEIVQCVPERISGGVHLVASRRVNKARSVYLYFCDFNDHIDLSFLENSQVEIRKKISKGDPTPSGNKYPYNVISIEYAGSDLDDEYNLRIERLIRSDWWRGHCVGSG